MEKVAEMSRSFQMVSMVPTQERRSRRGTSRVGESVIDRCTYRSTRNVGVLRYHHLQIVLMFGQLRASWSDLVRPRRSGHWKTTFPDTFEPDERASPRCSM